MVCSLTVQEGTSTYIYCIHINNYAHADQQKNTSSYLCLLHLCLYFCYKALLFLQKCFITKLTLSWPNLYAHSPPPCNINQVCERHCGNLLTFIQWPLLTSGSPSVWLCDWEHWTGFVQSNRLKLNISVIFVHWFICHLLIHSITDT